jgi:hypothetical protein
MTSENHSQQCECRQRLSHKYNGSAAMQAYLQDGLGVLQKVVLQGFMMWQLLLCKQAAVALQAMYLQ